MVPMTGIDLTGYTLSGARLAARWAFPNPLTFVCLFAAGRIMEAMKAEFHFSEQAPYTLSQFQVCNNGLRYIEVCLDNTLFFLFQFVKLLTN